MNSSQQKDAAMMEQQRLASFDSRAHQIIVEGEGLQRESDGDSEDEADFDLRESDGED